MRTINYERWEYHQEHPEPRSAPLWAFLYDVPYLTACGIFPPRHVLNHILGTGGDQGGMGPGAIWEPFEISEREYSEVIVNALNPDRAQLEMYARYPSQQWALDHEFDHIPEFEAWVDAACKKHRNTFRSRIGG